MRRIHPRVLTPALLALAVLAPGCGGDGSVLSSTAAGITSSTAAPATSSTSEATTTTAAPITTTTAASPTYQVGVAGHIPAVFPGVANGAHGSGCVTPGFDELPDGVWFGFIETVSPRMVTFDLACFFTGEAACVAQTADGAAATQADCLDFWIRNKVETPFGVSISPAARVWYVDALAPEWDHTVEIPWASWPTEASYQICASDNCAAWIYLNDGLATEIVEQYLP